MIQRIQTLFLLAAAALLAAMLFLPLAEIRTDAGELYTGLIRGLQDQNGGLLVATWPLFILVLVTAFLLLLNIFLYRRRKLQIRVCVYAIILGFGLVGLLYYFWVVIFRQLDVDSYWFRIPVVFPVLAIIFTYLAFRGIRKDEILIRSIDRIR
jgi:drug/metabolite transporter (DMT)-like permease